MNVECKLGGQSEKSAAEEWGRCKTLKYARRWRWMHYHGNNSVVDGRSRGWCVEWWKKPSRDSFSIVAVYKPWLRKWNFEDCHVRAEHYRLIWKRCILLRESTLREVQAASADGKGNDRNGAGKKTKGLPWIVCAMNSTVKGSQQLSLLDERYILSLSLSVSLFSNWSYAFSGKIRFSFVNKWMFIAYVKPRR